MALSEAVLLSLFKGSTFTLVEKPSVDCKVGLTYTRKFYAKFSLSATLVSLNSSFLDTCYSFQISFKKSKNLNIEKQ